MAQERPSKPIAVRLLWTVAALLVLVIVYRRDPFPHGPDLLRRSTKRLQERMWLPPGGQKYTWLSDNSLVFFTENGYDLLAVHVSLAPEQVAYLPRLHANELFYPQALSPDGTWILGQSKVPNPFINRAICLSGAHRSKTWSSATPPLVWRWLPDNRHWIEVVAARTSQGLQMVTHDLQGPDTRGPVVQADLGTPIGLTSDGHLICVMKSGDSNLPLVDYNLVTGGPAVHTLLAIPKHTRLGDMELSPTSDRIAFLSYVMKKPFFASITGESLEQFNQVVLWECLRNGSHPRILGTCPVHGGQNYPQLLHWTPDGRNLSFLYHNAVYTIPAD